MTKKTVSKKIVKKEVYGIVVKIRWGSESTQKDNYATSKSCDKYKFKTEAEAKAFLFGVEEGCGWLHYDILEMKNKKIN